MNKKRWEESVPSLESAAMSRATLIRQLAIEFVSDPAFKYTQALKDIATLSEVWLAGKGRHYGIEDNASRFFEWWLRHYEDCLIQDGARTTYDEFMSKFIEFARA